MKVNVLLWIVCCLLVANFYIIVSWHWQQERIFIMQAYQGYFEGGKFVSSGTVEIPERKRVILTVLDEPVQERHENKQAEAWQEFFDTVNASDEKIPETFERVNFSQKIDL
jgi:hypothetical protein